MELRAKFLLASGMRMAWFLAPGWPERACHWRYHGGRCSTGLVGADKGDGFDTRVITDSVDSVDGTVTTLMTPLGIPARLAEFSDDHRGTGDAFGRLEDESVTVTVAIGMDQMDHGGEVERSNSSGHTERFATSVRVHILSRPRFALPSESK